MVEGAHGLDAGPESTTEQPRSIPRRQNATDRVAAGGQDRNTDLSVWGRAKEIIELSAFREDAMVKLSRRALVGAVAVLLLFAAVPAQAADPIKVGMSLALTGTGAPAGKMLQ